MTNLWVNGRAEEDRDEWKEEVRAHSKECYDDKIKTSERCRQRGSAIKDAEVTAWSLFVADEYGSQSKGSSARGKMMKSKVNGPADCLVTEMPQCLPMGLRTRSRSGSTNGSEESAGHRGVEHTTHGFSRENWHQIRVRSSTRISCDRIVECVFQVVHDGSGGPAV